MAHILIADDQSQIRSLMRKALERAGHEVSEASDGAEALYAQRQRPADLIFCDLFMPGTDGIETIRAIRRDFRDAKIIAISGGFGQQLDLLKMARLLGATDTLAKPFSMSDVIDAVEQALSPTAP